MPLRRHGFHPLRRPAGTERTLFSQIDPELARDLSGALDAAGEKVLAGAVASLRVVEACHCDDPTCASFYAVDPFRAAWFWSHQGRTIVVAPGLSIDAAGDRIVCVEVHDRPRLKAALSLRYPTDRGFGRC
jgi:hypothetical protein